MALRHSHSPNTGYGPRDPARVMLETRVEMLGQSTHHVPRERQEVKKE